MIVHLDELFMGFVGPIDLELASIIRVTIPARKLYESIWSFVGIKELVLILSSIVLAL
jgi:hypothetical protein